VLPYVEKEDHTDHRNTPQSALEIFLTNRLGQVSPPKEARVDGFVCLLEKLVFGVIGVGSDELSEAAPPTTFETQSERSNTEYGNNIF